jgi:[CysO sulfur-carrier protein]-thiocarboxylate-dependent cysteine synthase
VATATRNHRVAVPSRDLSSTVGNTPLVHLRKLSPEGGARIWAKLEWFNPTGSVKDRIALAMLEDAERSGALRPGATIIEPTSGNTGISLAMLAKVRGYRLRAVMPETATAERKAQLEMYGAEIIFSDGEYGSNGAVALARRLAAEDPSLFMPFQYANPANPGAHERTTGPEILRDLDGQVDAFVAGLGTGGTLMGVGRALRAVNPEIQVIAAEPMQGDPVMGLRSLEDGYTPEVLNVSELSRKILVSNAESVVGLRALLDQEGLWAGVSSGAAVVVARRVAAAMSPDQNVAVLFADGGEKYASSGLWDRDAHQLDIEMDTKLWW